MNTGLLSKVYIVSTCSFHVSQLIMWPGTVMWKEVRFLFLKTIVCGVKTGVFVAPKLHFQDIVYISTTYISRLDVYSHGSTYFLRTTQRTQLEVAYAWVSV